MIDDLTRLKVLDLEIRLLQLRFESHDTGHLRTAVSVLQDRCQEIARGMETADRVAWELQRRDQEEIQ